MLRNVLALLAALSIALPALADTNALVGLWKAKRWFEPDVRGALIVQRTGDEYTADIAGRTLPIEVKGGELSFHLPNGEGSFRGRLESGVIRGHWFKPGVSPVQLKPSGPNQWLGTIDPGENTFTFFLLVRKRADGTFSAVLDNPERDHGARLNIESIVQEGNVVKLLNKEAKAVVTGTYDAENDVISLPFPSRGGMFDFKRDGDESDFYERGKNPGRYAYRKPLQLDDGWTTTSVNEVGLGRAAIEKTIQTIIDTPMDSIDTPVVDALLVARHGKLVLEEYFRGEDRSRMHDTRSASKSLVSVLAGAAIQAGEPLSLSSPVYKVMNGGTFPPDLEPRKRAMTLEHLLTMTSGFACDDWDDNAPYNEEVMWNLQDNGPADFYQWALNMPMARDPGEKTVYCSPGANLALGMIAKATGEFPVDLFDRLVAGPMKIDHYIWGTNRAGQAYGGGGSRFRARDFLKFGQLLLNGGTWNGRRILSRDFAMRASSPLYPFTERFHYGYLWWSMEYDYQGKKIRAFHAGGLGGQAVVVIPQFDMVIATFGSNYSSAGNYYVQLEIIPKYILPAADAR